MSNYEKVRWTSMLIGLVLVSAMIWSFLPVASSQDLDRTRNGDEKKSPLENFDIRYSKSEDKEAVIERASKNLRSEKKDELAKRTEVIEEETTKLSRRIKNLRVKVNEQLGAPEIVDVEKGDRFLTAPSTKSSEQIFRNFIKSNKTLYGVGEQELGEFETRAAYTNPDGNISWVHLERKINGLPVFRGEVTAALTKKGELVRTVGELTAGLESSALPKTPGISPQDAIVAGAKKIGVTVDPASLVVKETSPDGTKFVFEKGPFANDIKIELQYFPLAPGVADLSWVMQLWENNPAYYVAVSAEGGELYFCKNLTNDQTQTATYVVYGSDSPAPLSPGLNLMSATVPTDQGLAVGRDTFTLIQEHPLGNTDPWLPDGATTTTGNNVDSGMDLVAPDGIDAGSRPVSATRNFNFAYDPAPGFVMAPGDAPTGANYRFGEAVNMFFWTNRYHDRLYEVGFTEAARNFQQNNFGRGGLGNDRVLAQGQDFSGTSNANFLTPPDGTSGRMQMYIFNGPTPDRSSGLDQEIIIHELNHGTSNRLHGNAAGLNFAQGGGMGEGWGDFYARVLLSDASENINGIHGSGGYSTLDILAGYSNNYYYGIRRFPYALITTLGANGKPHNPLTFADVDAGKINLTDGAFPRGPIGSNTAHQVHAVGEVWCVTLFEVRARLIALHGFAVGNQRTLQLVTDGMKLNPADPTILQARDSILAASAASGGTPAEEKAIWEGFAARGMGFGATVSAASSAPITVGESFDTPNLTLGTVTLATEDCPDDNNAADPGETIQLAITLNNPLGASATGVTAQIVGGGSANYGTIAGNGSGVQNISYTVPGSAECGSTIILTININSSFGPTSKTYALQIGMPTGVIPAVNYSTGNLATPIPDTSTVDIPINVPDTGFVGDVNVKVRLNHSFDGDLVLSLVSPDGTIVPLSNNRGGSGDNYGTGANDCSGNFTVFDDAAANPISAGIAPFAGMFRPESPLSAFNGKQMNGTWKLRVSDTASLDTGTVGCAQLEIPEQLYYCCGVPGSPIINAAPPAVMVAESVAPANGAPDPDETVTMSFPLKNVGTGFTNNLVATLLPGGGVNAPSGPQSYGGFSPASPPVARNYSFVASGNCGDNITATFQLQDGATNLGTVTFTIRLGATVVGNTPGANAAAIAVPGTGTGASTGAPANPYPSTINIAGVTGTVSKVTATITNLNHTFPSDVDVLLVGPAGQKVMLMSDVGGGTDAVNATITFDDTAAAIGTTVVSGTFRPTNIGATDPFPAPAPAGPNGSMLSAFNNVNPNGAWSLYVVDDAGIDSGNINGGWSLNITTADPVCNFAPCMLNPPANIVVQNAPGQMGAVVNYPAPAYTGSCGVVTYSPPSGSFFPIGTTTVTITGTRQDNSTTTANFTVTVQYNFSLFYYSDLLLSQQALNQVTAGSNVPIRFSLSGFQGDPYISPPTSVQINCATYAPIGAATVIDRFTPDPFYSSLYDFYQTTWRTKTAWKFTCRELRLHFDDGTTKTLKFYFK